MATLIPEYTRGQIIDLHGSRAEADTYEALSSQLSDKYTVLYSVNWIARFEQHRPAEGEADFVVLHPDRGILVLEVKGGALEIYGGGKWVRRQAGLAETIPNPFVQAQDAAKTLAREISTRLGYSDVIRIVHHALVLPNIAFGLPEIGLGGSKEIVIEGTEMGSIGNRIEEIFDFWASSRDLQYAHDLPSNWLQLITEMLHPETVLDTNLAIEIASDERAFLRLTEGQKNALGLISKLPRACVTGGAGTGKTVLALAKAQSLAQSGRRTLLTCFNKPLADRLGEIATNTANLTVVTFHELCRQLAIEADLEVPKLGLTQAPTYFSETLPEMLLTAIDRLSSPRFDSIVVDETQDFEPDWLASLELLLGDHGSGVMFWFLDQAQNIYDKPEVVLGQMPECPLTENVRNTRSIHNSAVQFAPGLEMNCNGPNGRSIEKIEGNTRRDIRKAISRTLHRLTTEEHVDQADIAIVAGRSMNSTFLKDDRQFGAFRVRKIDEPGNSPVIESLWRYKGLEAPVILFVDFPESVTDPLRYVALSRAKSHAILIGSQRELDAWKV